MHIFNNPRWFWRKLTKTKLYNYLPDEVALKIKYRNHFFKKLDLKNPVTFNEKLQWLKLYDRRPEYVIMADKLASREYIASRIGRGHTVNVLGAWDSFQAIDFDLLPDKFVLKCTHGTGDTVICKDKRTFDKQKAKQLLEKSLRTDYYLISREWPYKDVTRKIIAEEYIEDSETHEARDYKFFCFDGKVRCFKVDFGRFKKHHAKWFYPDGNPIRYWYQHCPPDNSIDIVLPDQISEMIELAEQLSEGIPFLRVDFYCINGQVYVGELTLYPGAGLLRFTDDEWDREMGEWLILPKKQNVSKALEKELLNDIIREEKKIYIRKNTLFQSFTHSKRYLIWKFLSYYRKAQYYREKLNSVRGVNRFFTRIQYWYFSRRKNIFSEKCGIEIANGCKIGRRIRMWHGGIVINAHLGDDCLLHGNNILGNKGVYPYNQIPVLGNHVDVGAGAVIIDRIVIADYCKIGANSFVNKSFLEPGSVIAGIPAKILKKG